MQPPDIPETEDQRIAELRSLLLLDSSPEERFDRITRVAKQLFDVPIALVSLVDTDRQWFKSCIGLDVSETGRDISFCGHAILNDDVFIVEMGAKQEGDIKEICDLVEPQMGVITAVAEQQLPGLGQGISLTAPGGVRSRQVQLGPPQTELRLRF